MFDNFFHSPQVGVGFPKVSFRKTGDCCTANCRDCIKYLGQGYIAISEDNIKPGMHELSWCGQSQMVDTIYRCHCQRCS